MNDIEKLHAAVDEWNAALDNGDIERLVATCDSGVIICNERQPTTVGTQALRDNYGPKMEAVTFNSSTDIVDTMVYDDFALMIINFDVKVTDRTTGKEGGGAGRLVLGFLRNANGEWKIVLDVDNNDS